jgi:ABC-type glycerol-3-phosphate transport system substrate-binding protein
VKKNEALLLVAFVLAGLLPACTQAVPEKLEGKLTIWGPFSVTKDILERSGIIDDFEAQYPDIEVELRHLQYFVLLENLDVNLRTGGDEPDICVLNYDDEANYVRQGGLLDLTEYVKPYLDQLVDYEMFDCWGSGKYYCVPWSGEPAVLYYRRDVFEAAGLPSDPENVSAMVATWDDYLETCRIIKSRTGHYCFAHSKADNYNRLYEVLLWQQGLGYVGLETGTVTVDSRENVATLEMLGRFWKEDLVSDTMIGGDAWLNELDSVDQPVATVILSPFWMDVWLRMRISSETSGLWGATRLPAFEKGGRRAASLGGSLIVIPRTTQNPDAAWAFVEFLMTRRESQLKMLAFAGYLPALKAVYDGPAFLKGDPFYADQVVRQVYAEANSDIPRAGFSGSVNSASRTPVTIAMHRYATGQATAEEALREAAAEIREKLDAQ